MENRTMPKKRLPYREGDWFGVPLERHGFAVGRISRFDGRGAVLGYFFGPSRVRLPDIEELRSVAPKQAFWVQRFGDLHLLEGKWPIIRSIEWNRTEWPVPVFGRVDATGEMAWRVSYSDELVEVSEAPCRVVDAKFMPRDSLAGAGAIETIVSAVLEGKPSDNLQLRLAGCRSFLDKLK